MASKTDTEPRQATITENGYVRVPQSLWSQLGLGPRHQVTLKVEGDQIIIQKKEASNGVV